MPGSSSAIGSRAWARRSNASTAVSGTSSRVQLSPASRSARAWPSIKARTASIVSRVLSRPAMPWRRSTIRACASGLRQLSGSLGSTGSLAASRVSARQLRLSSTRAALGQQRRSCAAACVVRACSIRRVCSSCSELGAAQRRSNVNDRPGTVGSAGARTAEEGEGSTIEPPVVEGVNRSRRDGAWRGLMPASPASWSGAAWRNAVFRRAPVCSRCGSGPTHGGPAHRGRGRSGANSPR